MRAFEWILHEGQGHPKENYQGDAAWLLPKLPPFDHLANRAVNDARYGKGQVVQMAKARLPIGHPNRLRQEEYVWALAKLSASPVVLNTGYDFCGIGWGTTDCNRTGLSPALTDVRLGTPIDSAPYPAVCNGTSCMWVRRFQQGLVVVSAYGTPEARRRDPARHGRVPQGHRVPGRAPGQGPLRQLVPGRDQRDALVARLPVLTLTARR